MSTFRVRVRVRIRVGDRLGIGLGSEFDYFRHCAVCIAPNTESLASNDTVRHFIFTFIDVSMHVLLLFLSPLYYFYFIA